MFLCELSPKELDYRRNLKRHMTIRHTKRSMASGHLRLYNKQIIHYFRYMDDMVILHSDKNYLHELKIEIINYLKTNLDLELSKQQIYPTSSRGIDFVGYKLYHTHILLRKSIKKDFIKMVKYNYNDKSISSYEGWLGWCDSKHLKNKYIKTKNYEKVTKNRKRKGY